MRLSTFSTRFARWLALLAVITAAVMPVLAQSLRPAQGGNISMAMCLTATGGAVQTLSIPLNPQPDHVAFDHFEHCPYCAASSHFLALAAAEPWIPPPVLAASLHAAPPQLPRLPRTRHQLASPRGPPRFA